MTQYRVFCEWRDESHIQIQIFTPKEVEGFEDGPYSYSGPRGAIPLFNSYTKLFKVSPITNHEFFEDFDIPANLLFWKSIDLTAPAWLLHFSIRDESKGEESKAKCALSECLLKTRHLSSQILTMDEKEWIEIGEKAAKALEELTSRIGGKFATCKPFILFTISGKESKKCTHAAAARCDCTP